MFYEKKKKGKKRIITLEIMYHSLNVYLLESKEQNFQKE